MASYAMFQHRLDLLSFQISKQMTRHNQEAKTASLETLPLIFS